MQRKAFIDTLKREGFLEIVTVTREAGGAMDTHGHPFESKALILDGELTLRIGDSERCYVAGDVLHLRNNEQHAERYGPRGVQYLVGRK